MGHGFPFRTLEAMVEVSRPGACSDSRAMAIPARVIPASVAIVVLWMVASCGSSWNQIPGSIWAHR